MSSKEYWMGQAIGEAIGRGAEVGQWVEYAKKLEQAIIDLRKSSNGQAAVRTALTSALIKSDPQNPLCNQSYRQKIFDDAYAKPVTVSGK